MELMTTNIQGTFSSLLQKKYETSYCLKAQKINDYLMTSCYISKMH